MTDDVNDQPDGLAKVPARAATRTAVPDDAEWRLVTQVPFDEDDTHDLTSAIVVAVAETEDVSPMEIEEPPLYEVIDVVALEAAFFGSPEIGQSSDGYRSVEFLYRDHRIVVRSDAWVQVFDPVER